MSNWVTDESLIQKLWEKAQVIDCDNIGGFYTITSKVNNSTYNWFAGRKQWQKFYIVDDNGVLSGVYNQEAHKILKNNRPKRTLGTMDLKPGEKFVVEGKTYTKISPAKHHSFIRCINEDFVVQSFHVDTMVD